MCVLGILSRACLSRNLPSQIAIMLLYGLQLLALASTVVSHTYPKCKATPGSKGWPSSHEWSRFNKTLSGKLIKPSPPGAACHPDQSTYDPSACPAIQAGWKTSVWHTQNPVSSIVDNYNNDTCLPIPEAPCSGEGYPIYVVNATTAQDVKKGVDFARKHDIRLIVKGTGHDYLGRYTMTLPICRQPIYFFLDPRHRTLYLSGRITSKACLSTMASNQNGAPT